MSYSFSVKCATREEAIDAVVVAMEEVVNGQPIHAHDREAAIEAAAGIINALPGGLERDVEVSVSGSLGWEGTYPDSHVIISASVGASASLTKREADEDERIAA